MDVCVICVQDHRHLMDGMLMEVVMKYAKMLHGLILTLLPMVLPILTAT